MKILSKFAISNKLILIAPLVILVIILFGFKKNSNDPLVSSQAQKIVNNCKSFNYKEQCYLDQFKLLTEKKDAEFAKKTLLELQNIDPANSRGCHLIAHYISIAETRKDPAKWLELLKNEDSNLCSGGFIHGILEVHIADESDFELNSQTFSQICSQVKDKPKGLNSCYHNLGHLLLVQEQNNIDDSIKVCNQIAEGRLKYECLSGMFMENLTRLNLEAHGLGSIKAWNQAFIDETEKLCQAYQGLPAQACWKEISYLYWSVNNRDPERLAEECKKAPNKASQDECYIYGAGNMTSSAYFKKENLKKLCTNYLQEPELYTRCGYQVVGAMLSNSLSYSDWAIEFCSNTEEDFKQRCFNRMGIALDNATVSKTQKQQICDNVPDSYKDYCLTPK